MNNLKVITQLKITSEELQALFLKATAAGLSIPELLEAFIADLTNSERRNGSDEADIAAHWFERCGFSDPYRQEITFSMWLAAESRLQDAFDIIFTLEDLEEEQERLEDDPEALEDLKADQAAAREDLQDLFEEYANECGADQGIKEALEDLKRTLTQYKDFNGVGILETPKKGN